MKSILNKNQLMQICFHGDSVVNNLPTIQESQKTRVHSLGQEDTWEEEMATHFNILT